MWSEGVIGIPDAKDKEKYTKCHYWVKHYDEPSETYGINGGRISKLMAIACEEYGAKFFANGATPGGILEHPGVVKDPERVRESWNSAFGGSSNANKVAVLEEGMKYTPISISPEQAQFLETRKFQINEIARIFRIPPHMIGDLEKSSFSNIEQQSLEFVKYTLDPWVCRWEQSMNIAAMRVRVTFQKNTVIVDKYGNHKTGWADYFSCWATVGTSSGSESSGVVINPEESLDFTCRHCSELADVESTKYRIIAEGRTYNITYVNPMGYKHNSLKFNCKLEKNA